MKVRILLFGIARDIVGNTHLELDQPEPLDVSRDGRLLDENIDLSTTVRQKLAGIGVFSAVSHRVSACFLCVSGCRISLLCGQNHLCLLTNGNRA